MELYWLLHPSDLTFFTFRFFKFYLPAMPTPPPPIHYQNTARLFLFWPSSRLHHLPLWCWAPPRVKDHHLDLGGLCFHSIITWVAVFLSIVVSITVLMDQSTKGARQSNIKHAPKTKPHRPTFHDKCSLHCFPYSGIFSIAYRQPHKPGSIWADVTPDLLVGAWYKVWLCGGPNNGSLVTFSTWGKPCKGQPNR
jgi:hypothetical protein